METDGKIAFQKYISIHYLPLKTDYLPLYKAREGQVIIFASTRVGKVFIYYIFTYILITCPSNPLYRGK